MTNTLIRQPTGISIIIPNFNGEAFLPSCLKSLIASIKLCPSSNFEIILVDNASSDSSASLFNSFFSNHTPHSISHTLIRLTANTGFAYAVNRGIEAAKYDYVCVCNNDLTVDKSWFPQIISAISDPLYSKLYTPYSISTFFGLVLNKDGTKVESRGLRFYPYGKAENIDNGHVYPSEALAKEGHTPYSISHTPYIIWGASASIVVYHKPTLLKVGLFDERFFAYIEDVDLAYRLNKSGFKTLFVPQAISYHLGGGTSSAIPLLRQKMTLINWTKFLLKNYTITDYVLNLPLILVERFRQLFGLIK